MEKWQLGKPKRYAPINKKRSINAVLNTTPVFLKELLTDFTRFDAWII